ncbi:TetR/AcrR family transcriptional regulator [Ruania alba]|uniref:DNA-binding transcriptional regulator, AcrR family n=1 Tax=Ruania alba TaxID=648782 RepID=A0A1H5CQZ0_9MICO|nr:TetR/AcrR family transcriptional regulator [Ruania alba]SED69087.1 DNA-binding transcriptional regulator, AcrR family [Ruania alba]
MTVEPEPDRLLALLWRGTVTAPKRRGPVPSRSVDQLVRAAVELADQDGVRSLSVRALATAVGIAPMSVYTHVPDKDGLLVLMVDAVLGELPTGPWERWGWRRRVREVADAHRALLVAHPWLIDAEALNRPALGPGGIAAYEWELGALTPLGLDDLSTDHARTLVLSFVRAHARSEQNVARAVAASGMDDMQWWAVNGPLLEQVIDPTRYPLATRIGAAAGAAQGSAYDGDRAYEFSLARILDGIATAS